MGYDYMIRVSVKGKEYEKFMKDELNRARDVYTSLSENDNFPLFATKSRHRIYSYGPDEELKKELFKFTSQFPDYTFKFYYTFWDCSNICIYKIKNKEIISEVSRDFENDVLKVGKFKIWLTLDDHSYSFSEYEISENIVNFL